MTKEALREPSRPGLLVWVSKSDWKAFSFVCEGS